MTPEARFILAKATEFLAKADSMLDAGWPDEAGRAAYLAGFHAAQALILERTGDAPRTHAGVHAMFGQVGRTEPGLDRDLLRFPSRAFALKSAADYATSPEAQVTEATARAALAEARRLVAAVTIALGAEGGAP